MLSNKRKPLLNKQMKPTAPAKTFIARLCDRRQGTPVGIVDGFWR